MPPDIVMAAGLDAFKKTNLLMKIPSLVTSHDDWLEPQVLKVAYLWKPDARACQQDTGMSVFHQRLQNASDGIKEKHCEIRDAEDDRLLA